MDKGAIKGFAIEARKILRETAVTEAGFYGITKDEIKRPVQKGNDFEVYETIAGTENRIYGNDIKRRANLVKAIEKDGFEHVIEETAYTWFNRLIAIRFMEVNDYLPTRVRVLSSETGSNTPDIVTQSLDVDLNMSAEELEKVQNAKAENRYDDAFCLLFIKQCNELNEILPGLFEKTDDYMELLLKLTYTNDGVVRMLVDNIPEKNFDVEAEGQVEIIGWMYQYYNTELKDDTFAKLKKNVKISKERIPAATQLFTPDWIVRYMVENSVGRVWIDHLRANDSTIDEKAKAEEYGWKYYLPEAEQEPEVEQKLVEIRNTYRDLEPKDITCIDPCMGSGHILVYMFDVLMDIYRSESFNEREAVFSILEHNIRGLDIDQRAYQLSYFALMMKARGYNRRFFRGVEKEDGEREIVEPCVFAIEESNDVKREQLEYFGAGLNEAEKNDAMNQMTGLLDALEDAKEYGSIINIDEYNWELLRRFVRKENTDGQISFDTIGIDETKKQLKKLIEIGSVMAHKYHVVSTNPPYMGLSNGDGKLNNYVKKHYPDSKTDLFAVFIERCGMMTAITGYQAMITQQGWMFLESYESLRGKLLFKKNFINMLHLGARAFDEISGEVVQTTTFLLRNIQEQRYMGRFVNLKDGKNENEKVTLFFQRLNAFDVSNVSFANMPKNIIAYWLSMNMVEHFTRTKKIIDYGVTKQGLITSDNERFLRCWYEVSHKEIGYKWFLYNKGGGFRRWYGNISYVVNWESNGKEICNFFDSKGKLKSRPQNAQYYFKDGLTWNDISTTLFCCRRVYNDMIFDASGPMLFLKCDQNLNYILGLLNSNTVQNFLNVICQGLHYSTGHIPQIPVIIDKKDMVEEIVTNSVELAKSDWDCDETSINFNRNSLCKRLNKISNVFNLWNVECNEKFHKMKNNEEELNRIFIEIYGLQDELTPEVDDKDITIRKADLSRDIRSLISYAVGCMFGRYSLDEEGLIYAGGDWDASKYKTFIPDTDGIIPITDEEYFQDDIVNRFVEFVKVVYGEETLEENLNFVAQALGNKGETSREVIRNYFINDFYKDHCNTYSVTGSGKRPIYWLFDSGKQNGFKALIYMHRYNRDTVGTIRSDYLHKVQDILESRLKNAEYIISTSTSAVDKAQATKAKNKYVKQLNETRTYYQALSHIALQRIEIDLDDGVKHNYQLFQGVEVSSEGSKKQTIDLLAKLK